MGRSGSDLLTGDDYGSEVADGGESDFYDGLGAKQSGQKTEEPDERPGAIQGTFLPRGPSPDVRADDRFSDREEPLRRDTTTGASNSQKRPAERPFLSPSGEPAVQSRPAAGGSQPRSEAAIDRLMRTAGDDAQLPNSFTLDDLPAIIEAATGVPVQLDAVSVQDQGLALDEEIRSPQLGSLPLGRRLRAVLEPRGLVAVPDDGAVRIMSVADARHLEQTRIHRLPPELVDLPDEVVTEMLINHTGTPDAWEQLGGTGRLTVLPGGRVLVSADPLTQRTVEATLGLFDEATEGEATENGATDSEVAAEAKPQQSDSSGRVEAALAKPTAFEFAGNSLEQIVEFLGDSHQIPIFLQEDALAEVGIGLDEPIMITLSGVSLGSALDTMLQPLGLDYVVENEALKITSRDRADDVATQAVYPVPPGYTGEQDLTNLLNLAGHRLQVGAVADGTDYQLLPSGLYISANRRGHARVRDLLDLLRQAAPDEAGTIDVPPGLPKKVDAPKTTKEPAGGSGGGLGGGGGFGSGGGLGGGFF